MLVTTRAIRRLLTLMCASAFCACAASAQTTVVLQAPDSEVTDCFIRGGSHANTVTNTTALASKVHPTDPAYTRRPLLKFDTETRVPAGAVIQSATLMLTIKATDPETRTLGAYVLTTPFQESQATWYTRKTGYKWTAAGGDLGSKYAQASAPALVAAKVSFDVTSLVQAVVNGKFGSRYARIALVDLGAASNTSYKEFHSSEAADPSVRPTLTVVYGGASTAPAPAPAPTTATLKVLHWNTHHGGVGTDGKYDPNRIASWIATINPHVASLNEVDTQSQVDAIVSRLATKTGVKWNVSLSGRGNLLITRLPVDSESICTYNASYPRKAPHMGVTVNGRTINIWSAHLAVDSGSVRLAEVKALQACAQDWPENRIVAGDFNMQSSSTEYQTMAKPYADAWLAAKSLGTTTNYPGNCDGCTRNSRIDYVFTSTGASTLAVKSAQIVDTRDANGVMPSDHKPMLVTYAVK